MNVAPDVAPVVDAAVLSPAAVALAVVARLAPGGWRDARRQEMCARQRSEAGLPRS
jgi:hypothetical protein